jgi:micrococcal nuclease
MMFEYAAIVKRVVDGDTIILDIDLGFDIWLKNQSVRFYGIDAPEQRTKDLLEKKCGQLATKVVEQFCPEGSVIKISTHLNEKGKFGRILGRIYAQTDGIWFCVNNYLVDNRYAVEYSGQSKEDIKKEHQFNFQYLIENNEIVVD